MVELPAKLCSTLVLVGRTGNGKSATGNSILGTNAFISRARSAGVTSTCELHRTVQGDGHILSVIDTPGLFDFSGDFEFICKEIVKCINIAKDGIHALLLVLSVRSRFSKEEEAAICGLQNLFGSKIYDYMIIVFTGGDELEANGETLEEFLGDDDCPEPLKETLLLCGNRRVLFDNRTDVERKQREQVQELLFLVDKVMAKNGGQPFTNEMFTDLQKGTRELQEQSEKINSLEGCSKQEISELREQMHKSQVEMRKSQEEMLKRITEMVMSKLGDTVNMLKQQLVEEQAARLKAEEATKDVLLKSIEEMRNLRMHSDERIRQMKLELNESLKTNTEFSNEQIRQLRKDLEEAQKKAKLENEEIDKLKKDVKDAKANVKKLKEEAKTRGSGKDMRSVKCFTF